MVARILRNKYLMALLVVMALAAIFGLASASRPRSATSSRASASGRATVSSATRACPAPGSGGATASSVALAAAAAGTGQAKVIPLTPSGTATPQAAQQSATQPGRQSLLSVPTAPVPGPNASAGAGGRVSGGGTVPTGPVQGGVMIQATGAMARGFEAEQADSGGLASAQCLAPGTDFWFVGPGQRSVSSIDLYLMNTDSQPADATVQIITDSGPILGSTDAGITVPPHGAVMQSLASVVNGSQALALNVTTSVGRVVAAVLESSGGPGAWLPPVARPSTSQLLPGLPGTPGNATLYVAVPGGDNAQLTLTAITARGSYQPTGGTGINLPGGSAVPVPLASLAGIPAAVRVTSTVPVTVSMSVPGGAQGAPGAFTASSAPVMEQGVVAGNPGSAAGTSAVVLSAPKGKATVRVAELAAPGQSAPAPQVVKIAAGHTAVASLSAQGSPFAVVVTPLAGSGPVYAARVVTQGGAAVSIIPMTSALTWVPLPPVNDSDGAAIP